MKLAEWFSLNRPKAKYDFGDRVFGVYKIGDHKIPFIGSVGSDGLRNEEEGIMVSITTDLPMNIDGTFTRIIRVPRSMIKGKLKEY